MKILMLNSEYNGVAYWRCFEPARWLNMNYSDVSVTYFPHKQGIYKTTSEWERLAKSHDVIVCSRVSNVESLTTMFAVREFSEKPMVIELDDDWTCVEPTNLAYKHWKRGSSCYQVATAQMSHGDLFQFSTKPLMKSITNTFKKRGVSWISPNLIDMERFDSLNKEKEKRERTKEITIGWAGSATHYGDFLSIWGALKRIAEMYPEVKFHFKGMKADYFFRDKGGIEQAGDQAKLYKESFCDPKRIKVTDGVLFWDWNKAVSEMDIDLVVVPITDTKFNRGKSNCRYLEFGAHKIPGVYSKVYPYENTINHGKDGYLASTEDQWVEYISKLIEDKYLREEIAENAYKTVLENYSFQNQIGVWKKNYEEMAEKIASMEFTSLYGEV